VNLLNNDVVPDRLPKTLSARWEDDRAGFEKRLRDGEKAPQKAVVVAVSLDDVLVPMKDGRREEKRAATRARGQIAKDPAGYHEASCGTLSFYDRAGDLLATKRLGRMPEAGKVSFKAALTDELDAALVQRPDLRVIGIADSSHPRVRFVDVSSDALIVATAELEQRYGKSAGPRVPPKTPL